MWYRQLALGAAVALACWAGTAAAQGAPGTVQGKVVAEGTGEPVAGATVAIQGSSHSATTDASGAFRIANVPPGQVVLVARYVGREPARDTVMVSPGGVTQAEVTMKGAVQLAAIEVSATRSTTTLEHMPLHATVIGTAALQLKPAQTMDQVLRDVPGMNFTGVPFYVSDPTGHQTKMRGVAGNSKVLMLLDGIPIHDPFYSTTQWFKVPMSSVERIEVVRGGNSSLWGNQAVAGVVNFITKQPVGNGEQLDVSYGSLNTTNVAASKNFQFGSSLAIRLYGDVLNTDGYQTTPDAYLSTVPGKGTSAARNGNVGGAIYYTPNETVKAFFRAGYHRQNEDIGGYTLGQNLQQSPDGAVGFSKFFNQNSHIDLRAWGQSQSFDKYNGAACYLQTAANCNTTATTSPLVQYANSHDDNPYHELGGSAIFSSVNRPGMFSSFQGGVDYRTVAGEDNAITWNKPTSTDISTSAISRTNHGKGTQQFIGAFSQFRVTPVAPFEVTASLRYDYWTNQNGVAEMVKYTNGVAGSTQSTLVPDSHLSSFNPSLLARLSLNDHVSVRGAIYKSFRAPGLNNLYRSFSSATSITIANPLLSPERLTGGEFGANVQAGPLTFGATAFQYKTKGLITSYKVASAAVAPQAVIDICGPTLANCPATVNLNTNSQDALSRGVELVGSLKPVRRVTLEGGYTYTDSRYTASTTGDPIDTQLGAIPRHLLTANATVEPTSHWSVSGSVRYNTFMYLDINQTVPQEHFVLLGLSTSYRLNRQVEVHASGANLTNVKYIDSGTTSAAAATLSLGRTVTAGLRLAL